MASKKMRARKPISQKFLDAYIESALWSSTNEETGRSFSDDNYDVDDIAPESMRKIIEETNDFQQTNRKLLERVSSRFGVGDEEHGHNFWLTRNRHGAGFWDRGYGDLGDKLTEMAHSYGEQYPMIGDDGKIHF